MLFTWQCCVQSIVLIGLISEYWCLRKSSDWYAPWLKIVCLVSNILLKVVYKCIFGLFFQTNLTLILWWVLDLFIYRQQEWKKVSSTKQYNKDWYILTHLVEPSAQNCLSRKQVYTNINITTHTHTHKNEITHWIPWPINRSVNQRKVLQRGSDFQLFLKVTKADRVHPACRCMSCSSVMSNLRYFFSPQHWTIVNSKSFISKYFLLWWPLLIWHQLVKEALWIRQNNKK